jgi:hypothetical protein
MARIRLDQAGAGSQQGESTIVERLRSGKAVPILSSTLVNDRLLGGEEALVQAYADFYKYPLAERNLAEITQYRGITDERIRDPLMLREEYLTFAKSRLFDLAEKSGLSAERRAEVDAEFDTLLLDEMSQRLGYPPSQDDQSNPFLLLAALKLPIYLTTSYHSLLEDALQRNGCQPQSDYCRWNQKLVNEPSVLRKGFEPSVTQPLVYHLHGWETMPESLVLTEDDHYRFLMACAQDAGKSTDPVHDRVRRELSLSSLLLLGYSLRSVEFRSLFWGLIVTRSDKKASVVSIHLKPNPVEQQYLEKYLQKDHNFEVSWGDVGAYLQKLYQDVID